MNISLKIIDSLSNLFYYIFNNLNKEATFYYMLISSNKHVQYNQTSSVKTKEVNEEPKDIFISSCEAEKSGSHHVANAGFGISSVLSIGQDLRRLLKVLTRPKIAAYIPGLNAGVATLETYHAIKHMSNKDHISAAGSAGNAFGCAGSVLEDLGTASAVISNAKHLTSLKFIGSAFGVIGGAIGIVSGTAQLKEGHKTHSKRTITTGALDVTSGATSVAGAVLVATGIAAPVGIALLITASAVDLGGLAVDYLWKKSEQREAARNAMLKEGNRPQEQPSEELVK